MTVPVDYGRFLAMADRLLTRWGQVGELSRATTSGGKSYNPTPGAPETTPARFALVDYRSDQIDGTRIKATDKQLYVSPLAPGVEPPTAIGFEPTEGDAVKDALGASLGKVIAVETIRPATVTCLYILQVRR